MLITFSVHEHAKAAAGGAQTAASRVLVSMYIGDGNNFYREFSRDYIPVC